MALSEVGTFLTKNWFSIVRDSIAIAGFIFTIATLLRTKRAAEAAKIAAEDATDKVQKNIAKIDAVSVLNLAIATVDRIYDFQRQGSWDRVPDFYRNARTLLAKVKGSGSALSLQDKDYIQAAVAEFARIEESIEARLLKQIDIEDMPVMNQLISKHSEEFTRMEADLRSRQEQP